jgi:hypothetical protein
MRYLKTFESQLNNYFYLDFSKIETTDTRGYFTLLEILQTNNLGLQEFINDIRFNLLQIGIIKESTTFQLIGTGQYGIAFSFNNKVLKVTTSKAEFETSYEFLGMEYEGIVKYYLSFQYLNLPIWIIIQDKVNPLPSFERAIYTTLYYLGVNDMVNPKFKFSSIDELIHSLQRRLRYPKKEDELPAHIISKRDLISYFKKYSKLRDKLIANGISVDDLHGENIGLIDDKLVHFDIMKVN